MDVKFQEYVRGVKVKLSVEDAPMTALRALVDAFVTACSEVEAKQPQGAVGIGVKHFRDPQADAKNAAWQVTGSSMVYPPSDVHTGALHYRADIAAVDHEYVSELAEPVDEAPKKRGRPRKVAEAAGPVEATEDSETGNAPAAPAEESPETSPNGAEAALTKSGNADAAPVESLPNETPATGEVKATPETAGTGGATDAPSESLPVEKTADEEPVTDTELQRFSARIAQHFGNPQKVFDLASQFVPGGAVPRPTNIRDADLRWKFIRAAETASGLKYHG